MRKINLMAAAVILGGATASFATPASAYFWVPDGKLFWYCCKSPDAVCCSSGGCQVDATGCTKL
jgi:hypothetical protein